jgi:plastocyanin
VTPRRTAITLCTFALAVGVAAAVALVALGAAGSKASPVGASLSSGFRPSTVTAKPGAVVYFKNLDGLPHNAVANKKVKGKPAFTSGSATSGNFKLIASKTPGTYTFRCTVHGFTGKLRVKR